MSAVSAPETYEMRMVSRLGCAKARSSNQGQPGGILGVYRIGQSVAFLLPEGGVNGLPEDDGSPYQVHVTRMELSLASVVDRQAVGQREVESSGAARLEHQATTALQHLAGDPRRVVARQEQHRSGNVVRFANATERCLSDHAFDHFPRRDCGHVCFRQARGHRVDADTLRPKLHSQSRSDALHRGLRTRIRRGTRHRRLGNGRGDVDDRATILGKKGDRLTGGDQHALHVDSKGLLDCVVAEFDQRPQCPDPCVVDEDVQALELFDDKANRIGRCALLSDIRSDVANRTRKFSGELREGLCKRRLRSEAVKRAVEK